MAGDELTLKQKIKTCWMVLRIKIRRRDNKTPHVIDAVQRIRLPSKRRQHCPTICPVCAYFRYVQQYQWCQYYGWKAAGTLWNRSAQIACFRVSIISRHYFNNLGFFFWWPETCPYNARDTALFERDWFVV